MKYFKDLDKSVQDRILIALSKYTDNIDSEKVQAEYCGILESEPPLAIWQIFYENTPLTSIGVWEEQNIDILKRNNKS